LDELQTDLIEAYVDLGGLGVGTHQVSPKAQFLIPQDSKLGVLVVKDVLPQYIEVTIAEPPTPTPTPTLEITATPEPTAVISPTVTIMATLAATVPVTDTVPETEPPAPPGTPSAS
jgi:hypothetical protein